MMMTKGKHYLKNKNEIHMDWIIIAFLFVTETAYGIYLGYFKGVLLGDAVSRTANAFYVFFCKPYRFTSMGLVWNPLPSTLQLPFVLLAKFWRPFVTKGIGAAVVSASFAAWQARTLLSTFKLLKVERFPSLMITLLFCLNPYIFFYGANGMSEIIFIAFGIKIVCSLSIWMRKGGASYLIVIAVGFVGMFLTRYEAVPFAISVALGMCIQILFSRRERKYYPPNDRIEQLYYMEGSLWVTFFPLIFSAFVWIFYNWSITGNPLYFLNSGYSMNAYSNYYTSYGGLSGAISYVWVRIWPFLMVFCGIFVIRVMSGILSQPDSIIITVVTLGLSVFQFFMISAGKSGGYIRYLCYPMMFAAAWIPYQLSVLKEAKRNIAAILIAVVLVCNSLYVLWAFQHSSLMREDTLLMIPENSKQVATYINSHLKNNGRILMDSYRTYYIIMNVDNVDNLVVSCSPDFEKAVQDPVKYNIDYLVVPQIGSYGNMDALNIAHPNLYWNGGEWCREVTSIGEFKIYKVLR